MTCPICCQPFISREFTRSNLAARIPYLLSCGHSFCNTCLLKRAKQEKTVINCPLCKTTTTLQGEPCQINSLQPNIYLMGLAMIPPQFHPLKSVGLAFSKVSPELHRTNAEDRSHAMRELCGECSVREVTCRCLKCDCKMCTTCFEHVHKMSKILRKHQPIPLYEDESLATVPATCALHNNRPIEYYCEEDGCAICSHCIVLGEHKNHSKLIALENKNKDAVAQLEPSVKAASSVLTRLRKSEKLLLYTMKTIRGGMSEFREEIHRQFQKCHTYLQKRETEILEEVGTLFMSELQTLSNMVVSLRAEIHRVQRTLKDTERAMNNQHHLMLNAQEVLRQLNSVQEIPCYLQLDKCTTPARLHINDTELEMLKKLGTVDMSSFAKVNLVPSAELSPEQLQEDDDDESLSTASLNSQSTTASTTPFTSRSNSYNDTVSEYDCKNSNNVLSTLIEASKTLGDKKCKSKGFKKIRFIKGQFCHVNLTHIKSPCSFMVQRCQDSEDLYRLSERLQRQYSMPVIELESQLVIEKDKPVVAQFTGDNLWYRAVIRSVIHEDPDPSKAKVEVLYVDFGNSEVIPVTRVKKIYPSLMKHPEFATHVSLVDIAPADKSGQWTLDAVQSLAQMTEGKPMIMFVAKEVREGDPRLLIDLCKPVGDDGADNQPVSVRDALVFLEMAILLPGGATSPRPVPQRKFVTPEPVRPNQQFQCFITHGNSPTDFYIQQTSCTQWVVEMMNNLKKVYSSETSLWSVFYPQLDLVCVAQYSEDEQWYRAIVVGVPGRCKVDVLYVDFGNTARVHYTKLKCIQPSFLVLPVQARHCCLADIRPVSEEGWSTEAVSYLCSMSTQSLKAIVSEVKDTQLCLILYTEEGVCINHKLVEDGYAVSTGPGSLRKNDTVCDIPIEKPLKTTAIVQKQKAPQGVIGGGASVKDKGPDKSSYMEASVTHIENPGNFFIQLNMAQESGLNGLMDSLARTCMNTAPRDRHWQAGDHCAVRRGRDWYRGLIQSIQDDLTFKVETVDYGFMVEAKSADLRALPAQAQDQPSFALRCHLSGLQPAGTGNVWTRTAIEYLGEVLEDQKVLLFPKGPREGGSLPCDLLLVEEKEGDALNPERIEYLSVTAMMLDRGVALPNRRLIPPVSGPQITVPPRPVSPAARAAPSAAPGSSPSDTSTYDTAKESSRSQTPDSVNAEEWCTPLHHDTSSSDGSAVQTVQVKGVVKHTHEPAQPIAPNNEVLPAKQEIGTTTNAEIQDSTTDITANNTSSIDGMRSTSVKVEPGTESSDLQQVKTESEEVIIKTEKTETVPEAGTPKGEMQPLAKAISESSTQKLEVKEDKGAGGEPDNGGCHTEKSSHNTCSLSEASSFFPPPVVSSTETFTAVPTFVDGEMCIYVQELKPDEDMEGRFGFFLKENTLETIIQNAYLARQRLRRAHIPRDGNCLFRALAQVIFGDQGQQNSVRQLVVRRLASDWEAGDAVTIAVLAGQDVDRKVYLEQMGRDGIYGGEPEIQAASREFGVDIDVYIGGLECPITTRHYSTSGEGGADRHRVVGSGEAQAAIKAKTPVAGGPPALVRLLYVSDGHCDNGHYDLAVETDEVAREIDSIYFTWRNLRLEDLRQWPQFADNASYGDYEEVHVESCNYLEVVLLERHPAIGCLSSEPHGFEDDTLLAQMSAHLQKHYASVPPPDDATTSWSPGQSVIARFTEDDDYYRSRVMEVTDEGIKVKYIDFGNSEVLPPDRLRQDLILTEIPQQCIACKLHGIYPKSMDGTWSKSILDTVHSLIVSKTFYIDVVVPPRPGEILQVHMRLPDGSDLGTHFVNAGLATSEKMTQSTSIPSHADIADDDKDAETYSVNDDQDESSGLQRIVPSPYHQVDLSIGAIFPVIPTAVTSPAEVYVQRSLLEVDDCEEQEAINSELQQLIEMNSILSSEAPNYPRLKCVSPGMACCAKYSCDDCWYRAEVLSLERVNEQTVANVLFVDYGNKEQITTKKLRTLPETFLQLRAQGICCHLAGLQPPEDAKKFPPETIQLMNEILSERIFLAEIKAVVPLVELHLFPLDCGNTDDPGLVYDPLIKKGVVRFYSKITEDGTLVEEDQDMPEREADIDRQLREC